MAVWLAVWDCNDCPTRGLDGGGGGGGAGGGALQFAWVCEVDERRSGPKTRPYESLWLYDARFLRASSIAGAAFCLLVCDRQAGKQAHFELYCAGQASNGKGVGGGAKWCVDWGWKGGGWCVVDRCVVGGCQCAQVNGWIWMKGWQPGTSWAVLERLGWALEAAWLGRLLLGRGSLVGCQPVESWLLAQWLADGIAAATHPVKKRRCLWSDICVFRQRDGNWPQRDDRSW
ncbi:hypothetical protein FPQ18DRAFT_52958 [Pyronema domesticum]|nr:hypothetical protein FPQ18DRAFT_52958 [Pyronema domesticum]